MKILIIIPFFNESKHIEKCLKSFINQSYKLNQIVLVDDQSSDDSLEIVKKYKKDNVKILQTSASSERKPGKKVINAFNYGLSKIDVKQFDLIGKFDADIILTYEYFEKMVKAFKGNKNLGMCSGLLYIYQNQRWIYENISSKSKIRGPIKLYNVSCFHQIGGLKNCIGWDSIDQYLAKYYNWDTKVIKEIRVKHLKPTGSGYSKNHAAEFGKSLLLMRYGLFIALIAISKLSFKKKSISFFLTACYGYVRAVLRNETPLVSKDEGKFIRQYRMQSIKKNLGIAKNQPS